ncbi:MAG: histidine phosphatase family protein [Bacteroidales bacterium]|nr:histidine phosphatase family protein [Bacteroidales bacterium]
MSEITRITVIRHGETEWNQTMRLQGKQDSPLTKKGWEQAEKVAAAIKDEKFDCFITSDLGRALDTSKVINRYHNLKLIKNENLRERNFGVMEGLTRDEIKDKFTEVYNGYMHRKEKYEIPGGESLVTFYKRVTDEMNVIVRKYKGQNILVVAHGGVLDCIMRMMFNYPLSARRGFSIYNAAINMFSYEDNKWMLEQWGNTDHLDQTGSLDELKKPI